MFLFSFVLKLGIVLLKWMYDMNYKQIFGNEVMQTDEYYIVGADVETVFSFLSYSLQWRTFNSSSELIFIV